LEEVLVLVDENDVETGSGFKMAVHTSGVRHRAFSIFLWNEQGELLLQRRAATKYHSAGLWANTCCGHPRPGEPVQLAASRRLGEELGMNSELRPMGVYSYVARLPNLLIENELVHLFSGLAAQPPLPNPDEVDLVRWVRPEALMADLEANPSSYAAWFALYLTDIPSRILASPAVQ
jgi:isopentenyl-diphosphate delta-isomerase